MRSVVNESMSDFSPDLKMSKYNMSALVIYFPCCAKQYFYFFIHLLHRYIFSRHHLCNLWSFNRVLFFPTVRVKKQTNKQTNKQSINNWNQPTIWSLFNFSKFNIQFNYYCNILLQQLSNKINNHFWSLENSFSKRKCSGKKLKSR